MVDVKREVQRGSADVAVRRDESRDGHVVGFIDLGTNSVRLMLVRVRPDHSYAVISLQREPVRLGQQEFASRRIQPEAMERALLACAGFARLARSLGASEIIGVATSATREATNRGMFLRRLREQTGVEVHAISGHEEARLIYLGVRSRVDIGERTALAIDIGGGSTEVIVGTARDHLYMDSLSIGALRLTEDVLGSRPAAGQAPAGGQALAGGLVAAGAERVSEAALTALRRRVALKSAHAAVELRRFRIDVAYGTSGTIRNLAAAGARLREAAPSREQPLSRSDLRKLLPMLAAMTSEERARVPGISPERADIIVAGAVILESLMTAAGVKEIVALGDCGVREGLLVDYLERTGHEGLVKELSVRARSVLQLARATKFDEAHADRVRVRALELFDSSRRAGIHDLAERERDLLAYAALLHDIGSFISYRDHHRHSAYLVRNADLLGFDNDEIQIMAAVVLFHRKSMPGDRHPALEGLRRKDKEAVGVLSVLLRLAEALDRSRAACVRAARLGVDGSGGAILEISSGGDCHLERWAVERQKETVRRALGREFEIAVAEERAPRA